MLRVEAFVAAGRYPEEMIAGEEPDLSMRLRARGWRLARIDGEMTLHDAAMTRFGQWWTRTRRGGHAFAELAHRHPDSAWPDWAAQCRRIWRWGGLLPGLATAGLLLAAVAGAGWLLVPLAVLVATGANALRIGLRRRREGLPPRLAFASGILLMAGKVPEFLGFVSFHLNRMRHRRSRLIEYKTA